MKVISAVGLGTKTVVSVRRATSRLDSASVEITAVGLTVSPSTAVVGREVTITGSGFTGNVATSIKVGDAAVCDTEDSVAISRLPVADGW